MYTKTKLKNGMRVIVAPLQETKAVTVLVMVKVGSRYEPKNINGSSHFVEHLMFKGTKKRPTALTITKLLDGIGAEYNAFTSKDATGYYIKANYEKVELLLDLLSDMLRNSTFISKEVERERGVIVEEINMYEDNPMMFMEDLFEQTVWGDHPLGRNIAGPKSVIQKVTQRQLHTYYKKYYKPHNMVLAVAGRVDKNIGRLIKKYFDSGTTATGKFKFKPAATSQRQPQVAVKEKDTEQVQLGLGFPAYQYRSKKLYPLYLLNVIMGGNMSSRLFMSIREKKGLCYFIRSSVSPYEDTGAFMIQAGLDKARIREAVTAILQELKKVRQLGVTTTELRKAKDFLKGKLILDLEASDHVASWLSRQEMLHGKIVTPAEQIKKLERVTPADIKKVAGELFVTPKLNVALIGPVQTDNSFFKLLQL